MSESRCVLQTALHRAGECLGAGCPFWAADENACVLRGVQIDLVCRPPLAEHLLELRTTLEAARAAATS